MACIICFNMAATESRVTCSAAAHIICAPCLPGYLRQVRPADLEASLGEVPCPARPSCGGRWPLAELRPFLDVDTLVAFASSLGAGLYEALSRRRRAEDEEKLMRAALAAEPGECVRMLRALVTERDLAPACPRCSAAFVDFDGCYALSCARCGAGVCALCLADCGVDSHEHVRRTHPSGDFDDGERTAFKVACRARSALAVVRRVQALRDRPEVQRALVHALAGDLDATGLDGAELLARAGVPRVGAGSWRDLHDAAVSGDVARMATLVAGGLSVNATDEVYATPLQHAAFHGRIKAIQWLLQNGADASLTSDGLFGGTALHHAARMGSLTACQMLLDAPGRAAWINQLDKRGLSPLHSAAIGGHKNVVDLLLYCDAAMATTKSSDGRKARQLWIYHQGHNDVPRGL